MTKIVLPWSTTTLTYDKENRLTVYNQDGAVTTYSYDGDGKKKTETVSGVTTTILWDGNTYFGEINSGNYTKRYYTVNDQVVSYEQTAPSTGTRKDFLTDHLGSVTAEMDMSQTRTYDGRYFPYGLTIWSSNTPDKYGWIGSWGYRTTGLFRVSHYVRARHYSNQVQSWTTCDPVWPDENAIQYVNGQPTLKIDPSGNGPFKCEKCYNSLGAAWFLSPVHWCCHKYIHCLMCCVLNHEFGIECAWEFQTSQNSDGTSTDIKISRNIGCMLGVRANVPTSECGKACKEATEGKGVGKGDKRRNWGCSKNKNCKEIPKNAPYVPNFGVLPWYCYNCSPFLKVPIGPGQFTW